MKDIKHLLMVALAFLAVIAAFLVARRLLTPKTFGKLGHYRAAAVDEVKAKPVKYAGQEDCAMCHETQARMKRAAGHRGLSCETCHGPLAAHIEDPSAAQPVKPSGSEAREFCLVCHGKDASRPAAFPQVSAEEHNPGLACSLCHNPHGPKL